MVYLECNGMTLPEAVHQTFIAIIQDQRHLRQVVYAHTHPPEPAKKDHKHSSKRATSAMRVESKWV